MADFWKSAREALQPIFRPTGTIIEGIRPGDWASPQQPIRPIGQLQTGVRQWDFTPGINLQFTPRGDVPIKFGQLWSTANSFDLCRLVIETRKDQIVNRAWSIRVKPKAGESKKDRLGRESNVKAVGEITNLLRFPDGVHSFDIWLRMWLEELLVFDAPTIFPVRNMLGDVIALRLISGTTITPLLDDYGFIPLPPNPAYQQIILGIPTNNLQAPDPSSVRKYMADEIVYSPRNPRVNSRWGFGPVEQIITTLAIASNRQQFLLDYYKSGNVPEGLLPMPESWTSSQIKDFQNWFDAMLAGNLAKKRRLIMIPDAKHPVQFSKHEALTDITDDYLVRVVAYAFSISPQNLVKQVNRGTAKESSDIAQMEGLEPYLKHIENVLNGIILRVIGNTEVEFAYEDEREVDPLAQAKADDLNLRNGSTTINQVREARGDDPLPNPEANEPGIYTVQGWVALGETATPAESDTGAAKPAAKFRKRQSMKIVAGDFTPNTRHAKGEMLRKLTTFLSAQRVRVAATCREGFMATKVMKGKTKDDTERAAAILAMISWEYPEIYREVRPYLETAAVEGAKTGAFQVTAYSGDSMADALEVASSKARRAAAGRAAEMFGLVDDGTIAEATGPHWAISTTAKDDVLNAIKQAIQEDWSPDQLDSVIQAIGIFTPQHAEIIADNELSHQQASGHLESWKQSKKVLEYAWTVQDLGCCPACEGFSLQGSVPVGHEFAPFIFEPGAHPSCRCWLTATKVEGDDANQA